MLNKVALTEFPVRLLEWHFVINAPQKYYLRAELIQNSIHLNKHNK